jgi:imidazolonepropionase-like amidohydrolase
MRLVRFRAVVLSSALAAALPAQEPSPPEALAFTDVSVIDATSEAPRPRQTVIVRDHRIVAVGPVEATPVPAGARVVNAQGKFLIPGLWDMHVHTDVPAGRGLLALYVANGVTGVRDMAGDWQRLSEWRREIAAGALVGPRIVASGPYLEGGDIPIPHLLVRKPEDATPAVDSLARLGVDFVKVHGQLTRESYFAIARAVRERGLTFAGHIPRGVTAAEASDSGQKSLEHLLAIPNACSPAEAKQLAPRHPLQGFLGQCTAADMAPLFARIVRNGTWIVPTLVAAVEIAMLPSRDLPADTLAHFLPDTLKRYVQEIFQLPTLPPGADSVGRALFAKRVEVVGAMHRAGVALMTGTDAPVRNSPPGFGMHEELALFVRAGLSPWDALRAATLQPARFLGAADSSGTIEPGKVADLVLLDADPLADIRNTRRIAMVVANGRLYRPECLLPTAAPSSGGCE